AVLLEGLDVLLRLYLPEVFIPDTPSRIAVESLLRAEDRERDAGRTQDLHERARDLLVEPVDGRRAADEVQPFGVGLLRVRRHAELLRPIAPCFSRLAPGFAGALDVRHRALRLGRRRAFHEREVAAHIDALVDVLDRHRTRLDACRAGRAGPELFRLRLAEMRGRGDLALGLGEELGAVAHQLVADAENDALRVERLAGRERGAVVRAAAAFRAGVAIEQLLPAQVPERGRAPGASGGAWGPRDGPPRTRSQRGPARGKCGSYTGRARCRARGSGSRRSRRWGDPSSRA